MVASHAPSTGDLACNPGTCPDWELNWQPFGSQTHAQSTELQQPGLLHLLLYGPPNPFSSDSCYCVPCIHEPLSILFISLFCSFRSHILIEIIWYLSVSDWLISLNIIISRSIHAVMKGKIVFFFMAIWYIVS